MPLIECLWLLRAPSAESNGVIAATSLYILQTMLCYTAAYCPAQPAASLASTRCPASSKHVVLALWVRPFFVSRPGKPQHHEGLSDPASSLTAWPCD